MEQRTYNYMVLLAFLFSLISMSNTVTSTFSFNGSTMDMNGTTLINGTVPSDNDKVNKSGDNMTGNLNMSGYNLTGLYNNFGFVKFLYTPSIGDVSLDIGMDGIWTPFRVTVAADSAVTGGFILSKARGSINSPNNVSNGDRLGAMIIQGYYNGTYTNVGSVMAEVDGVTGEYNKPARLVFQTTNKNATVRTTKMTIGSEGAITITNLSGHGNTFVCVYNNGTLYNC